MRIIYLCVYIFLTHNIPVLSQFPVKLLYTVSAFSGDKNFIPMVGSGISFNVYKIKDDFCFIHDVSFGFMPLTNFKNSHSKLIHKSFIRSNSVLQIFWNGNEINYSSFDIIPLSYTYNHLIDGKNTIPRSYNFHGLASGLGLNIKNIIRFKYLYTWNHEILRKKIDYTTPYYFELNLLGNIKKFNLYVYGGGLFVRSSLDSISKMFVRSPQFGLEGGLSFDFDLGSLFYTGFSIINSSQIQIKGYNYNSEVDTPNIYHISEDYYGSMNFGVKFHRELTDNMNYFKQLLSGSRTELGIGYITQRITNNNPSAKFEKLNNKIGYHIALHLFLPRVFYGRTFLVIKAKFVPNYFGDYYTISTPTEPRQYVSPKGLNNWNYSVGLKIGLTRNSYVKIEKD